MDVILKLSPENLNVIAEKVEEIQSKKKQEKEKKLLDQEKQYTVNEVAEMSKRKQWTVRDHIARGLLKASKVGKSFLISETNYKKYINNEQ